MRHRHGFTLIELLVVIGIIALLIAMLMPTLTGAKRSANGLACANNLQQLYMAEQMYATQNADHLTPAVAYQMPTKPAIFANGSPAWQDALRDLLHQKKADIFECPGHGEGVTNTYGINGFIMLSQWNARLSRRSDLGSKNTITGPMGVQRIEVLPPSEMVLFADKGPSTDAILRSSEGWAYYYTNNSMLNTWQLWVNHSPIDSYRHGGRGQPTANAVFLDGHVGPVRAEMSISAGHLSPGVGSPSFMIASGSCCQ